MKFFNTLKLRKQLHKSTFILVALLLCSNMWSQSPESFGGLVELSSHKMGDHDHSKCITAIERKAISAQLEESIRALQAEGKAQTINSRSMVSFDWPVVSSSTLNNASNWGRSYGISNYVDHNTGTGITDYACSNRTYDGHNGTDIFSWPFSWYLMENDLVEVVAAAPGQIIYKESGRDSYSCSFNGSRWNAVYVQHSDGSIAWYGHLKAHSLTHKRVGDYVSSGEFLGIVGSSGNSTGPHLHFEVYKGAPYTRANLIDPFAGRCNGLNSDTYFNRQRPHNEPRLNAIYTHKVLPVFGCSSEERTNFEDDFNPGERIYLTRFFSDQNYRSNTQLRLYRPDGSIYSEWTHESPDNYVASWWYTYFDLPSGEMQGEWTYQVNYGSTTLEKKFNLGVTGCGTPNKPSLVDRGHNYIELDWSDVNNAQSYNIYQWNGSNWIFYDIAYTSDYRVEGLSPSSIYFFRVTATCNVTESEPSGYIQATTTRRPSCASPNRPVVIDNQPTEVTIEWNSVADAIEYQVFSWNGASWILVGNTTSTRYTISTSPNTSYYLAVRSKCSYGTSDLSSYVHCKTPRGYTCGVPNRPTVSNVTRNSVKLDWNDISGTRYYKVYYWDGSRWVAFANTTSSSYTVTNLSAASTYYFTVSAVCHAGEGARSSVKSVTTKTTQVCLPTQKPWATDIDFDELRLNWNAVSGANYYDVYYWDGYSWIKFHTTSTTSMRVTNLTPNDTYYFSIITKCSYGYSERSSYVTVKTLDNTYCAKPTGLYAYNVKATTANLAWNAINGAQGYEIFYWNGSSWNSIGAVSTPYTLVRYLRPSTTYYFRIRTICSSGVSYLTDYISLRTTYGLTSGGSEEVSLEGDEPTTLRAQGKTELTTVGEVINDIIPEEENDDLNIEEKTILQDYQIELEKVFPNPALGGQVINLTVYSYSDQNLQISFIGQDGRIVKEDNINVIEGSETYNTTTPSEGGYYILMLIDENGNKSYTKVIVQ